MEISILGECMVELAPTDSPKLMQTGFAGDTFNTAWYLAQICSDAAQVSYVTRIGTDTLSAEFTAFAQDAGIDMRHALADPQRTLGLYMIHLSGGERSFSYWRSNSAAKRLADDADALKAAFATSIAIYFSGITIAILDDTGRETLFDVLTEARSTGKTIVFDTNLRPKLWDSPDQMRAETTRFAGCADILLPSFDDEAEHFGDTTIDVTATRYLDCGARLVVVKNAANAALIATADDTRKIDLPSVAAPVDTTAAGDSFNAGFLADYLQRGDAERAIATGAALARSVIMGRGALVPAALEKFALS